MNLEELSDPFESIHRAAEIIRRGGVVAFPTETVYGLGADAFNPLAVARIFEINGQISELRGQQRALLDLLEEDGSLKGASRILHTLQRLGREAGIDPDNFGAIHAEFERSSPEAHRRLLGFLGFAEAEIEKFLGALEKKA